MSEQKKCPYCGSSRTETTFIGGAEQVGAGLLAGGAAIFTGLLSQSHATHVAHHIMHSVGHQYKCKNCGKTFHA